MHKGADGMDILLDYQILPRNSSTLPFHFHPMLFLEALASLGPGLSLTHSVTRSHICLGRAGHAYATSHTGHSYPILS